MRRFLKRMVRPVAGAVMLVVAVVSSAQCVIGAQITREQRVSCAAMQHDCGGIALRSSCCTREIQKAEGVVALKPVSGLVLLAVLSPSVSILIQQRAACSTDTSSTGPPGVPTYLLVSSFRI